MLFETAGSERFRIDSSGHLLHGVTADEDTSGSGGVRFINAGDIQIDGDQKALVFRSTGSTAQLQSGIEWWNENGAGVQAKIVCDRTSVTYAPSDLVFYTNTNVDTSANNSEGDITERLRIDSVGQVLPGADDAQNLGSSTKRWKNIYAADMHFSNQGKINDVDGTWGDWTLQEGEDSVFMINNRTGKKYAITMKEVN